jgi:hypothetical protein
VSRSHGGQIVAGQVGHQRRQGVIVMVVEQRADARRRAEVVLQVSAPCRPALEGQCRIEIVGAVVDPLPQGTAAGAREGGLQLLAVFQRMDGPAHAGE